MTGRPSTPVLVIAVGGAEGPADVRPFVANVLRRRIRAERVEAVENVKAADVQLTAKAALAAGQEVVEFRERMSSGTRQP